MMRKAQTMHEEVLVARTIETTTAPQPSGQVIVFEQFRLFRRSWWRVLLIAVVATVATGIYLFNFVPVEFRSTVVALPPNKSGTPLDNIVGGISSTLKDFGFKSLIGGRGSNAAGYSNMALLKSPAIYDSLIDKYDLFSVYDLPRDRRDKVYDAIDDHMLVVVDEEGPISISFYDTDAKRAAQMANDVIGFTNRLSVNFNRLETEPITKFVGERYEKARAEQARMGGELREFMQRTKLYDPESQSKIVGGAVMEAQTSEAAQRALVEVYTNALGAEDARTVQAKGLLNSYQEQIRRLTSGQGTVKSLSVDALPASTVEYLRLRQDYETNAKVMALLEPLYEQTKFDEMRDIPVLNVLHPATPSPVKARPKRSIILLSAFVGTFVFCYIVIALIVYSRGFLRRYQLYMAGAGRAGWESISNGDSHS